MLTIAELVFHVMCILIRFEPVFMREIASDDLIKSMLIIVEKLKKMNSYDTDDMDMEELFFTTLTLLFAYNPKAYELYNRN
jgi:hypothetical protein